MRLTHRLAVLTVVGGTLAGLILVAPTVAAAKGASGCVVEERGGRSTDPEGATRGPFRCAAGTWGYGEGALVTTDRLIVDAAGALRIDTFTMSERSGNLTFGDLSTLAQLVSGDPAARIDRAVVTARSDKPPTQAQIDAVLAGKHVDGITVLGTVDQPDARMTLGDLVAGSGGSGPKSVYFNARSFLDDIIDWFVDLVRSIVDWVVAHCDTYVDGNGSVHVVCVW
ncbi:hypothetical protein [Virgisporangium aurantiacum]|uniref:Uncharacterized protein n=1 Tax=Virgisporangium aurantiacum TaxID=175570 RepID=A0A8J3Z6C0_9ACTN|nr:hypothetical protein [Virgisporangium aurantiacum]GIJ58214.1 hypothetical protein Vau01_057300 [Virgisporangium aurantiacum]